MLELPSSGPESSVLHLTRIRRVAGATSVALMFLLTACRDTLPTTASMAAAGDDESASRAKGTLFCPAGGAGAFADLSDAVAATPVNGTIVVCDGTHVLDDEVVDKPLTVRAVNAGAAVIRDADPAPTVEVAKPAIRVQGATGGTVRFKGLAFEPLGRAIEASGEWDRIEIEDVRFTGRSTTTAVPVYSNSNTNAAASIDISGSSFSDMHIGVLIVTAAAVQVRRSTFRNFGQGSVTLSGSGSSPQRASGTIEDSRFSECPFGGCIRFFGTNVRIARNRFDVRGEASVESAIRISRVTAAMDQRLPILIEDNIVVGERRGLAGQPATWNIQRGIWIVDGVGTVDVIRGNRFTNVWMGALLTADVDVHDNVFHTGDVGLAKVATSPHATLARRNDVVGFNTPLSVATPGVGASTDARCNWWGSVFGPVGAVVPATVVTSPWAGRPIANTSVACDPTVPSPPLDPQPVVRVCPVHGSGSVPTVPTVSLALKVVTSPGTIRFCTGTHFVRNVTIRAQAVTLESEVLLGAVLDGEGASTILSLIEPTSATPQPVTVRGLRFLNARGAIAIRGPRAGIRITESMIALPEIAWDAGEPGAGIWVNTGGGGDVVIERNRFSGGRHGVKSDFTGGVVVRNNWFSGHSAAPVEFSAGGPEAPVVAEGNLITGCGRNWCIGAFNQAATIRRNVLTVSHSAPAHGIWVNAGVHEIAENILLGLGGGRDLNAPETWPLREGISVHASTATVTGNRVSGAYTALNLEHAAGVATDNHIADVGTGMRFFGSAMAVQRNDLRKYGQALVSANSAGGTATCNWWGSTAGPQGVVVGFPGPNVPIAPWATSPIAGTERPCP